MVAEQLGRRGKWDAAAESLVAVIARDSTFALAYYRLLVAIGWGAVRPDLEADVIVAAGMRHLDRLPRRQRLLFLLLDASQGGRRIEALTRADELVAAYPDDAEAWMERGESYVHFGLALGESPEQALSSLERAIALDPGLPESYYHVVHLRFLLGDTAGAWRALEGMRGAAPEWEGTQASEVALRAGLRREDPATLVATAPANASPELAIAIEVAVLWLLNASPAEAVATADSFAGLARRSDRPRAQRVTALLRRHLYRLAQGRYHAAWDVLQQIADLAPEEPGVEVRVLMHRLVTRQRTAESREAAARLAAREAALPPVAPQLLAWLAATEGTLDSTAVARFRRVHPWPRPAFEPARDAMIAGLRGLVALRAGDSVSARAQLITSHQVRVPWDAASAWLGAYLPEAFFALQLARLELALGEGGAAARHLHDVLSLGLVYRAEAEELRGQIAEQQGDTATAIRAYRNFIGLWERADPELQPRVAAAHAALARLER